MGLRPHRLPSKISPEQLWSRMSGENSEKPSPERERPLPCTHGTSLASRHSLADLQMRRKLWTTVLTSYLWERGNGRRKKNSGDGSRTDNEHVIFQNYIQEPRCRLQTLKNGTVTARADTPLSYLVQSPRGVLRRNRSHLVPLTGTKARPEDNCGPVLSVDNPTADVPATPRLPTSPTKETAEMHYPTRERNPQRERTRILF